MTPVGDDIPDRNNVRKGCCIMFITKTKYKSAGSLCAVILAVSIVIMTSVFPLNTRAESEQADDGYKYAVTIEFGSMSFYYDYGTWDVSEMRYIADTSSTFPAAGTDNGFPGWYGFDGVTNRISFTYVNSYDGNANQGINVSLTYRSLTATELAGAGGSQVIDGVTMSFYEDKDFLTSQSASFVVKNNVKKEVYASLSGEPQASGGKFESGSFSPIGMLTIQIGDFSD